VINNVLIGKIIQLTYGVLFTIAWK